MKKFFLTLPATLLLVLATHRAEAQHVWTQHNNQERTGWYKSEQVLKQSNVSKNTFGLKFTCTVDDQVVGQPLVMMNITLPSVGAKNVMFVATVNNSIYCYDAESNGSYYWMRNFTNVNNLGGGSRPANNGDIHPSLCGGSYGDFTGQMGIVGTPVIDSATNTMYFVTKVVHGTVDNTPWGDVHPAPGVFREYTYSSNGFHQFLHAIDITNGNERANSPVEIAASAPGMGDGQVGGQVSFEPRRNFNRPGLALNNGKVYVAFGAHCDNNPSHGWMLAYDKSSLAQVSRFVTTPDDGRGGIWMAGGAPAIDAGGHIYFTTGNSLDETPDASKEFNTYNSDPSIAKNRGESVVELNADLTLNSYFTPHDYKLNNDADNDFGQQVMILPGTGKVMTGVKANKLYVMTQDALGGYNAATDNVVQTVPLPGGSSGHSNFAYYSSGAQAFVYQGSEGTPVTAFPVNGSGTLGAGIGGSQSIPNPGGLAGAYLSVSSNNLDASTAILWSYMPLPCAGAICNGVLRAFNASDITKELWNSTMNAADALPGYSKMNPPTIALGNVFVSTALNKILVYGLSNGTGCAQNVALNKPASSDGSVAATDANCCQPNLAFDANPDPGAPSRWAGNSTDNNYLQVDLGSKYDICKIAAFFESGGWPKDYSFTVSDDGMNFTPVYQKTGYDGTGLYQEASGAFSGRYVRFQGITRGTPYAYSLYELQVFGSPAAACGAPTNVVSTAVNDSTETISWSPVAGATQYILKYRPGRVESFVTRVVTDPTVTITHLDCGTAYSTTVQAICGAGNSAVTPAGFTTADCPASSCNQLATRTFSADLGDVGFNGEICRVGTVFTMSGSGSDIGGTADQFRYFWQDQDQDFTDKQVTARLLTHDQVSAGNKLGVMIRAYVSDNSPFVYLASVRNGESMVFQYRSDVGGPVTTTTLGGHTLPYYVRLSKFSDKFVASGSDDGINWTMLAGPVTVSTFGSDVGHPSSYGIAVTSAGNTAYSSGTFDAFAVGGSTPLPIKLTSFKATNAGNDHVLVTWSTSMEQNVDRFELQRAGEDGNFHVIGTIDAAGNSNVPVNYTFNDNAPLTGTNYYRLNEIDLDNKTYLSPVTQVDFGVAKDLQIFPNPVTTYVSITSGADPILEVVLYDVSGKVLQAKTSADGMRTATLNTASLARGMYIVRVKTKSKTYQQKIFKK